MRPGKSEVYRAIGRLEIQVRADAAVSSLETPVEFFFRSLEADFLLPQETCFFSLDLQLIG